MATVDYGTDLSFADLDLAEDGRVASGLELLQQAALIRLSTDRSVIDAPDDGVDLTNYISKAMTSAEVANLESVIETEMLKDERFTAARVSVDLSGQTLTINLELDSALGPFDLVLAAGPAGLEILGGQ